MAQAWREGIGKYCTQGLRTFLNGNGEKQQYNIFMISKNDQSE